MTSSGSPSTSPSASCAQGVVLTEIVVTLSMPRNLRAQTSSRSSWGPSTKLMMSWKAGLPRARAMQWRALPIHREVRPSGMVSTATRFQSIGVPPAQIKFGVQIREGLVPSPFQRKEKIKIIDDRDSSAQETSFNASQGVGIG